MKRLFPLFLAVALMAAAALAADRPEAGWKKIFDGKTLKDWKAIESPGNWTVEEDAIVGRGERSHLFYTGEQCENCEFQAEVRINKGGNSGMYFRARFETGWPNGYEAQVNNSHADPKRTGSLYNFADVKEQLIGDDTWWRQHIIARGNHIIINVNDRVVVDHVDEKNSYRKGYLALQQHHQGSEVRYRNIMMRKLPPGPR